VTEEDTRAGRSPDLRTLGLASLLLGASTGMAANLVSGMAADRAITPRAFISIALAAAAVLTAWRLRTLPPQAPILRYGVGLTLALSLITAMLTAIGPSNLAPYMIFGAVGLTGAAVLIQIEASNRPNAIYLITMGGVAVMLNGWADAEPELSRRIMLVGFGITAVGIVVALLVGGEPYGIVYIGVGVTVFSFGVALLVDRQPSGITFVGFGVAMVGFGVALLVGLSPDWIVYIGAGVTVFSFGVALLVDRQLLLGIAFVGGGLAVVGYGVSVAKEPGSFTDQQQLGDQSGEKSGR